MKPAGQTINIIPEGPCSESGGGEKKGKGGFKIRKKTLKRIGGNAGFACSSGGSEM